MKIAVLGAGISGLGSAYILSSKHKVDLYEKEDRFFTFQIVSLSIGIETNFLLFDGEKPIKIDVISTIRKRLKKSILNTVPFYLYSNKKVLSSEMKAELKNILFDIFE